MSEKQETSPKPWTIQEDNLGGKNILDAEGNGIMCTDGIWIEDMDLANAQFVCDASKRIPELEGRLTKMTQWLEANQPDLFSRGIWDAILEGVDDG